jgi:hypothetical protein
MNIVNIVQHYLRVKGSPSPHYSRTRTANNAGLTEGRKT